MGSKILLIEDEQDTVTMYADLLTQEGYDVRTARDGKEALETLHAFQPDLILLDIMLPGMNGLEIAKHLSERADTQNIPIIVVTALDNFALGDSLSSFAGVDRFIYKPCRPKTLLENIDDVLRYARKQK